MTIQFQSRILLKNGYLKLLSKELSSATSFTKDARNAPEFIIEGSRNFHLEKKKLCANLLKTQELGADYFNTKESHSFGKLTSQEWHNLFYKHLDHHLKQFAV